MGTSDESADASEYGTAELNDRGRLTIPKELREDLQLEGGTEFVVVREGGDIRLVRQLPALETLTRDEEWGEEAFRDAGEATFGGS
ncbi:AbrB/MazE/SpoVT family DNA-binding domain-containing protein [Halobacteriales archaeon QS_9_70_65]|nr:MAG: AbrB/MazE/SpoVT family DNA-binding domain-containing protein [Halobacteriales archaeon QS_9_70_65]